MEFVLLSLLMILSTASLIVLLILLFKLSKKTDKPVSSFLHDETRLARDEAAKAARELREEIATGQKNTTETLVKTMGEMAKTQTTNLESVAKHIKELTTSNEERLERLRGTIDIQLKHLQENNEKKLDQMRQTVDEKLQSTLEKRLGESFKVVSSHLEAVQRGLGEMQTLATGVGDLKRVLTNVKARGTWGEVQLGTILEQMFIPGQYSKNVQIREDSRETIEYAIRLPGRDEQPESYVWLPIDSKFPQEDYLRLVDAAEKADADGVQRATVALVRAVQSLAKDICDKYINPPTTTDFAIMFLPTEGLYAEVLRQPGLLEQIQQKFRIVMAGPTTLSAILNSLRMGFQTLAIGKRSTEVWNILAAVKTEFGKFGDVLGKVKKQLNTAVNTIDETSVRTRTMVRKLREVEQLPTGNSAKILEPPGQENTEILDGENNNNGGDAILENDIPF